MKMVSGRSRAGRSLGRTVLLMAIALVGALTIASPARAAFGLEGLVAAPANTAAGAHSDFHTHLDVTTPADQLRDLTVSLPPGLSGNPQSVPKCSVQELNGDDCPAASQIGTTTVQLTALSLVPLSVDGSVYNVVPGPGEPARLGIVLRPPDPTTLLLPPIVNQVEVKLRPDFGLDTILKDLPQNAAVLSLLPVPIQINSIDLDLDGAFMRNPTSCGTKTTEISARSWAMAEGDPSVTGTATFESTACDAQPYDPKATLEIDGNGQPLVLGANPTVTSVISQTAAEANNQRAAVVLPAAIGVDGERLAATCQPEAFQAGTCAETSKVATAKAVSPLLDSDLTGPVYVIESGGLPDVGVDLKGALPLKILGSSGLNNGRVETVFEGLPDLPLSRFELVFPGGQGGLMRVVGNPCDPNSTFDAGFTSQAGQTRSFTLPTTVKGTCPTGGGPNDGDQVKKPAARVKVKGAKRHKPRVSIRVESGGAAMNTLRVTLPGALKLGRAAARRIVVKADGKRVRGKGKLVAKGLKLNVRGLSGKGADVLTVNIPPKAIKKPRRVRAGKKLGFRLVVGRTGQQPAALRVTARAKR